MGWAARSGRLATWSLGRRPGPIESASRRLRPSTLSTLSTPRAFHPCRHRAGCPPGPAPCGCGRHLSTAERDLSSACPGLAPSLSTHFSTALSTRVARLVHDLSPLYPELVPRFIHRLVHSFTRLVPARSTGCPPTCPHAARRCRPPRREVRGRPRRPARLSPSDVNLRKLTSPLASRTFAGTRRESVRQPGFRAAAPPKGHTHKLSGKRTDRVGTHTRSPGCASGFSYSGERQ